MKAYTLDSDEVFLQVLPSSDLDWMPDSCRSVDFIGKNENFSKNQHRKINITSIFIFILKIPKLQFKEKSNSRKTL